MKLTRPVPVKTPTPGTGRPSVIRNRKPTWLYEWLEEQPDLVMLECGHHDDLNDPTRAYIITADKKVYVACYRCNKHMRVTGKYHFDFGIPNYTDPPF